MKNYLIWFAVGFLINELINYFLVFRPTKSLIKELEDFKSSLVTGLQEDLNIAAACLGKLKDTELASKYYWLGYFDLILILGKRMDLNKKHEIPGTLKRNKEWRNLPEETT